MSTIETRPVTAAEFPVWAMAVANAQGRDHDENSLQRVRGSLDLTRTRGAFDGHEPVGGLAIAPREMTLPGGARQSVAGITCAAVCPTHRRRGIFARLVRETFGQMHREGLESIAVVGAGRTPVHTRFGFGLATQTAVLEGDLARLELRPDVELGSGRVLLVDSEQAAYLMPRIHDRATAMNVGWVGRGERQWELLLDDLHRPVPGFTAARHAVHLDGKGTPMGYAVYRFQVATDAAGRDITRLVVPEVVAAHRSAHAQLWQFLLGLDAADVVRAQCTTDEPLQHMLGQPEVLDWRVNDGLALRLVDVPRALAARSYAGPVDVVIDVVDHLCEWNNGTFRLQSDEQGAMCVRTRGEPELTLGISALSAAYLGGVPLMTLALAGRVSTRRPAALERLSLAMRGFREPSCPASHAWPWH